VHIAGVENRTTISVTKPMRDDVSECKDQYGESWNEVLQFYVEHRDDVTVDDSDDMDVDASAIASEVSASIDYTELSARVAEELEGRMR